MIEFMHTTVDADNLEVEVRPFRVRLSTQIATAADPTAAANDSSSEPSAAALAEEFAVPDELFHSRDVAELLLMWLAITVRLLLWGKQMTAARAKKTVAAAAAQLSTQQALINSSSSRWSRFLLQMWCLGYSL
eukprot:gene12023-12168_t